MHPNLYPLAGDDRRLTYSKRDVQIRVGLELADSSLLSLLQVSAQRCFWNLSATDLHWISEQLGLEGIAASDSEAQLLICLVKHV